MSSQTVRFSGGLGGRRRSLPPEGNTAWEVLFFLGKAGRSGPSTRRQPLGPIKGPICDEGLLPAHASLSASIASTLCLSFGRSIATTFHTVSRRTPK